MTRVLVIDDDRETREVLDDQLRRAGHGVQLAATATEGIRLARERRPDGGLLDAGATGYDPCRAFAAHSKPICRRRESR